MTARRCLGALLLHGTGALLARLPQPLLLALARALSFATRPLQRRRARIAAINIALCFPHLDARAQARLVRATVDATITGLLEALRAWYAPARHLPRFRIDGVEHLHAALAHGRGAIVLLAHFTPLELALRLLREGSGLSFSSMKRPHNNACLEAEIDRRRRLHYGLTIDKDDPRGVRAALQRGELLIYAADQDFNFGHAFLPFFGVPAATLTATPRIARRSGAPVLPFLFHRAADGSYVLQVHAPWADYPGEDPVADTGRYLALVEQHARAHPEQYLWVHRRFKTRPPGMPSLY